MAERGLTFKEAVNNALRSALAASQRAAFRTPTFSMGRPTVPLDHALRIAAELEGAELQGELSVGK